MAATPRALPEALLGLAPARAASCPRCGSPTSALANGRGRLDICARCGTFEMTNPEGMQIFSLRGLELPPSSVKARPPPKGLS